MTQRQGGGTGPEHEGRPARRIATPFLLAIGLVLLVMVIAMAAFRPWEVDEESGGRTEPVTPTATR